MKSVDLSSSVVRRYLSTFVARKVVLIFQFVDETLVCDHSNESYWSVLKCSTVNYTVQGIKSVDHRYTETFQAVCCISSLDNMYWNASIFNDRVTHRPCMKRTPKIFRQLGFRTKINSLWTLFAAAETPPRGQKKTKHGDNHKSITEVATITAHANRLGRRVYKSEHRLEKARFYGIVLLNWLIRSIRDARRVLYFDNLHYSTCFEEENKPNSR